VFADVQEFTKWGKPIFFGELGCAATVYGAYQPWSLTPNGDATANEAVQRDYFQAYNEVFGTQP